VKRAITVGSSVFGVAAFAYAVHAIGLTNVEQALGRVGWGFALILLVSGVREVAKAAAWTQAFPDAHRLPVLDAFRARLAGEALSALVPMGFLIGEPTKAQHVEDRMPFATAFSALMLEYAFYIASLALLAGVALVLIAPWRVTLGAAAVGAVVIPALKPVRRAAEPLRRFAVQQPLRASTVAALQATYHALGIAETYIALRFLNPAGAAWTAAVAFELLNRGVTIVFKMVPMRAGVDEASAALMATHLAIGPATGVMLALVRKLRVLFWTALGVLAIAVRAFRRWAPARSCRGARLEEIARNRGVLTARSLP
jgi:lysylphosphatidylglycerol synthase-like protein